MLPAKAQERRPACRHEANWPDNEGYQTSSSTRWFCFLILVLRPFQEYFTYIEPFIKGEHKPENPGKKTPNLPQAELGFPTCHPSEARTTAIKNIMNLESTVLSAVLRGPASTRWIGMRIWERSHRGQKVSLSRVTTPIWKLCQSIWFYA